MKKEREPRKPILDIMAVGGMATMCYLGCSAVATTVLAPIAVPAIGIVTSVGIVATVVKSVS